MLLSTAIQRVIRRRHGRLHCKTITNHTHVYTETKHLHGNDDDDYTSPEAQHEIRKFLANCSDDLVSTVEDRRRCHDWKTKIS